MMDGPNLHDLRTRYFVRGGSFEPKCRKTVEACWDEISRVALHYWEGVSRQWKDATPKEVEKEYEALAKAATKMILAMQGLSAKAMSLAWGLSRQIASAEKLNPLNGTIRKQMEIRLNREPIHDAWAKCQGNAWFTDHVSRELRKLLREGAPKPSDVKGIVDARGRQPSPNNLKGLLDESNRRFDWGRLRELEHVLTIASHLQAMAASIKEEQTRRGSGASWAEDVRDTDPEGVLCRAIRDVLVNRKLFKTHARPIAREIFIWAHPDLQEDEWPSVQSFGVRRLK